MRQALAVASTLAQECYAAGGAVADPSVLLPAVDAAFTVVKNATRNFSEKLVASLDADTIIGRYPSVLKAEAPPERRSGKQGKPPAITSVVCPPGLAKLVAEHGAGAALPPLQKDAHPEVVVVDDSPPQVSPTTRRRRRHTHVGAPLAGGYAASLRALQSMLRLRLPCDEAGTGPQAHDGSGALTVAVSDIVRFWRGAGKRKEGRRVFAAAVELTLQVAAHMLCGSRWESVRRAFATATAKLSRASPEPESATILVVATVGGLKVRTQGMPGTLSALRQLLAAQRGLAVHTSVLALDTPPVKTLSLDYMTSLLALKDALQNVATPDGGVGRRIFHSQLPANATSALQVGAAASAGPDTARANLVAAPAVSSAAQPATVVAQLKEHLKLAKQALCAPAVKLEIPHEDRVLGMGFVVDLVNGQPTHRTNLYRSTMGTHSSDGRAGAGDTVLFTGVPPHGLYLQTARSWSHHTVIIGASVAQLARCVGKPTNVAAEQDGASEQHSHDTPGNRADQSDDSVDDAEADAKAAGMAIALTALREEHESVFFSALERLEVLAAGVQTAVVAQRPGAAAAISVLRQIVCYVRSHYERPAFDVGAVVHQATVRERCAFTRTRKRAVTTMQQILNDLANVADALRLAAGMQQTRANGGGDGGANPNSWLKCISEQVFAKDILQRLRRQAVKKAAGSAGSGGADVDEDRPRSAVIRELAAPFGGEQRPGASTALSADVRAFHHSNAEVARRMLEPANPFAASASVVDLLYMLSMVGVPMLVEDGNNAAAINPWRLRLAQVGGTSSVTTTHTALPDTATALCELYCQPSRADSQPAATTLATSKKARKKKKKKQAPPSTRFVLVLPGLPGMLSAGDRHVVEQFVHSRLHQHYMGVVFAHNPEVVLPGQRTALHFVAFCKVAEQLLLLPTGQPGKAHHEMVELLVTLWGSIRGRRGSRRGLWLQQIERVVRADDPALRLTESVDDNVQSVCQVLVPLVCLPTPRGTATEPVNGATGGSGADGGDVSAAVSSTGNSYLHARAQETETSAALNDFIFPPASLRRRGAGDGGVRGGSGGGGVGEGGDSVLANVALALMGEAVSRACRRLVGKNENRMWATLQATLAISPSSCREVLPDSEPEPRVVKHSGEWDLRVAKQRSGLFFRDDCARDANCSPWAIVSALGFARVLRRWCLDVGADGSRRSFADVDARTAFLAADQDASLREDLVGRLAGAYARGRVSMAAFMRRYYPGTDPMVCQVALFVSSIRYYTSKLRLAAPKEALDMSNPDLVVRMVASDVRGHIYQQRRMEKARRIRAVLRDQMQTNRLLRLRVLREDFMQAHNGMPKLFSVSEVEDLNQTRPPHDQLQLAGNSPGLLLHRCCFPDCEMFLVDLRTPRDFANPGGRRQHGLFQHLRWYTCPRSEDHLYFPALHRQALALLRRKQRAPSLDVFTELLWRPYRRTNKSHAHLRELARQLLAQWNERKRR